MHVSVIIPTKNGGDLFGESLRMIFAQYADFPWDVIVVDSGSTDRTLDICAGYPVKLIQIPPASFHHSATRNMAISAAQGDLCVLTVQDAVPVDRNWLAKLVEPMLHNTRIAGVFGQQMSRPEASALSVCCKFLWYQEWRKDWQLAHEQLPVPLVEWENLPSVRKLAHARFDNVNSCIRKSVWRNIPFPAISYAEDVAWAQEVLTAGYSIFWEPAASVLHSHERSLAYEFRRSYVDSKNISTLMGDQSSVITGGQARAVIAWLAEEVELFLRQVPVGLSGEIVRDFAKIAEADIRWQAKSRWKDGGTSGENSAPGAGTPLARDVKEAIFRYAIPLLAGAGRCAKKCREVFRHSRPPQDGGSSATLVAPMLLMELQCRHRFFYNQLLQVYFARKKKFSDAADVHCIRLGAAAMVGGSLLGQHMADVARLQKITTGNAGNSPLTNDQQFWRALAGWCGQGNSRQEYDLAALDQLMSGGV